MVDKNDDLISRKELLSEFRSLCGPQTGDGWDNMGVYNLIMRQKAVDAVPVEWFTRMIYSCGVQGQINAVAAMNWVLGEWKVTKEEWAKKQEAQDGNM